MTQYCTYIWKDPKTGIPRYVGEGDIVKRPYSHFNSSNNKLKNLLRRRKQEGYVLHPTIISATSKEDAIEMQDLLIDLIGRENNGTGPLFNVYGSGGSLTNGQETRYAVFGAATNSEAMVAHYQQPGVLDAHKEVMNEWYAVPENADKHKQGCIEWASSSEAKHKMAMGQVTRFTVQAERDKSAERQKAYCDRIGPEGLSARANKAWVTRRANELKKKSDV